MEYRSRKGKKDFYDINSARGISSRARTNRDGGLTTNRERGD